MDLFKCHPIFQALQTLLGISSLLLLCIPLAFCLCLYDSLYDLVLASLSFSTRLVLCTFGLLYQQNDWRHMALPPTNIVIVGMNEWSIHLWPQHAMLCKCLFILEQYRSVRVDVSLVMALSRWELETLTHPDVQRPVGKIPDDWRDFSVFIGMIGMVRIWPCVISPRTPTTVGSKSDSCRPERSASC